MDPAMQTELDDLEEADTGGDEPVDEDYTDQPGGGAEQRRDPLEPPTSGTPDRKESPPIYSDIEEADTGEEPLDEDYSAQPGGISADTGQPLMPLLSAAQIATTILGQPKPSAHREISKVIHPDLDWNDLRQTGWGVIVSKEANPQILESLSELLAHRESQASQLMFKKLHYQPGESARQFLARREAAPGVVDPDKVPYYLLIVGGPEDIPFSFQYQLGAGYGVGRLCFDQLEDYRSYAHHAVRAETQGVSLPRIASLFGVERDATTRRTTTQLIAPLADRLIRHTTGWSVRTWIRDDATRDRLRELLGGAQTPGVLVTASHGVAYRRGDRRQRARQGGLLCQDWPGLPEVAKPLDLDQMLCGEDLLPEAELHGLFVLLFACYGAGTPEENDFVHENGPRRIASRDFVARLPQRLLRQGALGVFGHVDRAWTCTFSWTTKGRQVTTIATVLQQLIDGHRAGRAMSYFGQRYAELAAQMTEVWEQIRKGRDPGSERFLAWLWTAHNDARNMILLGDPAARRVERST